MPNSPDQQIRGEFAVQNTDQSLASLGRAEAHPQSEHSQRGRYETIPIYNFNASGPLTWDWTNPITGLHDFASHYEPQGELAQERQNQNLATNDFSIPDPGIVYENASPTGRLKPFTPPQRPSSAQTGMSTKRKAELESHVGVSRDGGASAKRLNRSHSTSPPTVTTTAPEGHQPPPLTSSKSVDSASQVDSSTITEAQRRKRLHKGTGPQGRIIDVSQPRRVPESIGPNILPAGKVFPIQIATELFRLSGASISSDAPSYFSHFFGQQIHTSQGRASELRTLYIDRDPETFRDIAAHLQGYHVNPRDAEHFVRLFADAQFYSLPRLIKQLFSTDIFVRIGGVPFQIPRELFSSPGDSPNYFSLGFAQFFTTPTEVFPGLDRNTLLRPPSITPPSVPNRSGETFKELVKILQGYAVDIRDEVHRAELLRDARYFHLKGLEQKLIPHEISYNLKRTQSEILIRLEDIRQSGVSFVADLPINEISVSDSPTSSRSGSSPGPLLGGPQFRPGIVSYARPFTDDQTRSNVLILEISSVESTTLHLPADPPQLSHRADPIVLDVRATFHGTTLARITSLFSVIASKMGLPATQPLGLMLQSGGGVAAQPISPANSGLSESLVRVRITPDCHFEIDNHPSELMLDKESRRLGIRRIRTKQRRKLSSEQDYEAEGDEWIWGGVKYADLRNQPWGEAEDVVAPLDLVIKSAHWRLRVEPVDGEAQKMQVVLCGVRVEGYSEEKSRNSSRGFL